jgi:hypothetical protein
MTRTRNTVIDSVKERPYIEADNFSAVQEIPRCLWEEISSVFETARHM